MKRRIYSVILVLIATFLCGCTGGKDSITFHQEATALPNTQLASYDVSFGNTVGGATITAQLWENGVCTESDSLLLSCDAKKLSCLLTLDTPGTDIDAPEVTVQMGIDGDTGLFLCGFPLPEGILGYSFTAYGDNERLDVAVGEDMVLCAMAFDTGSGVRTVDCKSLAQDLEKVKEYSCILLIRAVFTAV